MKDEDFAYVKPDPTRYNEIPSEYLQGVKTILDVGSGNGAGQIGSIHYRFFEDNNACGRYTGIDVMPFAYTYLDIRIEDIITRKARLLYDVVIALHVLEHIEIEHWESVCQKLLDATAPNGVLIIGVPFKETKKYSISPNHVVLGIDEDMLLSYFPDMTFKYFRYIIPFHQDGKGIVYSFLRYLKRKLFGSYLLWPEKYFRVLGILKKE